MFNIFLLLIQRALSKFKKSTSWKHKPTKNLRSIRFFHHTRNGQIFLINSKIYILLEQISLILNRRNPNKKYQINHPLFYRSNNKRIVNKIDLNNSNQNKSKTVCLRPLKTFKLRTLQIGIYLLNLRHLFSMKLRQSMIIQTNKMKQRCL